MVAFVDSHCHFDFSEFDSDRKEVWQKCCELDVKSLLMPGVEEAQWPKLETLCTSNPALYFSIGIHPWWVNNAQLADKARIKQSIETFASHRQCVAIGEAGLDKMCDIDFSLQLQALEFQLAVCSELGLPLILHVVKAHNEMLVLLKKYPNVQGVIHAFSGSTEMAQNYCDRGFTLGVGGTITYDRAVKTRQAIKCIGLPNILLETDAPSMPLQGAQGRRNSPVAIPNIAAALADVVEESIETVADVTSHNAAQLFGVNW